MTSQGSVLFVDAYDSFAENIAALLHQHLDVHVTLIRIDCKIQERFRQSNDDFFGSFDAIVLGPGPGTPGNPDDVGLFLEAWECAEKQKIPVLAICLGFQSLCDRHGIPVVRMSLPCHGHAKAICHSNNDIFHDMGSILATCYNSLGVDLKEFQYHGIANHPSSSESSRSASFSESSDHGSIASDRSLALHALETVYGNDQQKQKDDLELLAWDNDGWVMATRHKLLPFYGFQFHPESCKSNLACHELVKRWWEAATSHNKQHRKPLRLQQPAGPVPREQDNAILKHSAKTLLSKMLSLTSACSDTVKSKSLHLPASSGMIADLCQQSSRPDRMAMLESTKRGRYSIYGFPHESSLLLESIPESARLYFSAQGNDHHEVYDIRRETLVAVLESFVHGRSFKDNETDLPFRGGFIGFMSYEFGTASLQLDVPKQDGPPPATPETSLLWVERSVVYDHDTGMAHVQSIRADDTWVEEMTTTLQRTYDASSESPASAKVVEAQKILSSATYTLPNHDKYISQIQACQSQLLAGNSYELCLTTEATITTPVRPDGPYLLYRNIQRHNPVPFASCISLNNTTILSSSPEQYLSWSVKDGTIDMIPMKGTVKRTPEMTLAKATAILSSAKESAENLMIADLIRHDLYNTVGQDAKVEVVKLCHVVESETVFSLVSHIRAHTPVTPNLEKTSDEYAQEMTKYGIRALTRTLPPGSMTGAPKKRSCEILHGLEQRHRGVYSGGIGYIDVCGNGAWSVCIRSAFSNRDDNVKDETTGEETQKWRIGAGGAITVLSDDEQEWEEMMTKLESVLKGFRVD